MVKTSIRRMIYLILRKQMISQISVDFEKKPLIQSHLTLFFEFYTKLILDSSVLQSTSSWISFRVFCYWAERGPRPARWWLKSLFVSLITCCPVTRLFRILKYGGHGIWDFSVCRRYGSVPKMALGGQWTAHSPFLTALLTSGLRVLYNVDKTNAVWIGSQRGSTDSFCDDFNIG